MKWKLRLDSEFSGHSLRCQLRKLPVYVRPRSLSDNEAFAESVVRYQKDLVLLGDRCVAGRGGTLSLNNLTGYRLSVYRTGPTILLLGSGQLTMFSSAMPQRSNLS